MTLRGRLLTCVLAASVLVALPGCGDGADGASSGPCEERRERLDPASANHVLAGAPEPSYTSDPPTSGPHAPAPPRTGLLDDQLPRPDQVGHLEGGGVLVQYGPEVGAADLRALEAVATGRVAVAPNADLPAPVVVTAWVRKLTCERVDIAAIEAFARAYEGQGPGSDG
jgi:hypothetical protein